MVMLCRWPVDAGGDITNFRIGPCAMRGRAGAGGAVSTRSLQSSGILGAATINTARGSLTGRPLGVARRCPPPRTEGMFVLGRET